MKQTQNWIPTKAIIRNGNLVPNLTNLFAGSYHTISLQLPVYQKTLCRHARGRMGDFGCGAVPYFDVYRNYVDSITCADFSANAFTDLTVDLNGTVPLEDQTFDTILLADVINHLSNPDKVFSEASRLLAPEGKLIVFTPFLYWINEAPNDYHRFSEFGLNKRCGENGLSVVSLTSYGSAWDVVLDLVFKKLANRWNFRVLKLLSDMTQLRSRAPKLSDPYPLGYALVAQRQSKNPENPKMSRDQ